MFTLPFLHAYADWGLLGLRLVLAAIFLVHGLSKRGMWKMQPSAQMPGSMIGIMRLLSVCEPLGALGVLTGVLAQWAAIGFCLVMLGAIYSKIVKWHMPFKAEDKTGWEFDLLILASSLVIVLMGPGAISLM